MEIKIYAHELHGLNITPEDESGIILNDEDINIICEAFKISHYVVEWEYIEDEVILYVAT
jgi:hypothetical protein